MSLMLLTQSGGALHHLRHRGIHWTRPGPQRLHRRHLQGLLPRLPQDRRVRQQRRSEVCHAPLCLPARELPHRRPGRRSWLQSLRAETCRWLQLGSYTRVRRKSSFAKVRSKIVCRFVSPPAIFCSVRFCQGRELFSVSGNVEGLIVKFGEFDVLKTFTSMLEMFTRVLGLVISCFLL